MPMCNIFHLLNYLSSLFLSVMYVAAAAYAVYTRYIHQTAQQQIGSTFLRTFCLVLDITSVNVNKLYAYNYNYVSKFKALNKFALERLKG